MTVSHLRHNSITMMGAIKGSSVQRGVSSDGCGRRAVIVYRHSAADCSKHGNIEINTYQQRSKFVPDKIMNVFKPLNSGQTYNTQATVAAVRGVCRGSQLASPARLGQSLGRQRIWCK